MYPFQIPEFKYLYESSGGTFGIWAGNRTVSYNRNLTNAVATSIARIPVAHPTTGIFLRFILAGQPHP